jgi:hypothetical protein
VFRHGCRTQRPVYTISEQVTVELASAWRKDEESVHAKSTLASGDSPPENTPPPTPIDGYHHSGKVTWLEIGVLDDNLSSMRKQFRIRDDTGKENAELAFVRQSVSGFQLVSAQSVVFLVSNGAIVVDGKNEYDLKLTK